MNTQTRLKRLIRVLGSLAFMAFGFPALAQDATSCFSRTDQGSKLQYENRCNQVVTMLYCSTGKPLFGRNCGAPGAAKANAYYTHLRTVEVGGKGELPPGDGMRIAACLGKFHEYDWRGFRAQTDGSYNCPTAAQLARSSRPDLEARATRPDRASACAAAKALIAPGDAKDGDCECRVSSKAASCVARGWMSEEQATEARSSSAGKALFLAVCEKAGQPPDCLSPRPVPNGSQRQRPVAGGERG